jgi:hypothetical protein
MEVITMNNKEKKSNKDKAKDEGSRFPFDCESFKGKGMLEMMRQCCGGEMNVPDCCADMVKKQDEKNAQPEANS